MTEYIEFAVRVPKGEADLFITRFGRENVRIYGCMLGEEIVRCRDCAYSIADGNGCGRWRDFIEVEPDGFCAWGERNVD